VASASHAKTAELIELLFGMVSEMGQRNRVVGGNACWHHLANMANDYARRL